MKTVCMNYGSIENLKVHGTGPRAFFPCLCHCMDHERSATKWLMKVNSFQLIDWWLIDWLLDDCNGVIIGRCVAASCTFLTSHPSSVAMWLMCCLLPLLWLEQGVEPTFAQSGPLEVLSACQNLPTHDAESTFDCEKRETDPATRWFPFLYDQSGHQGCISQSNAEIVAHAILCWCKWIYFFLV